MTTSVFPTLLWLGYDVVRTAQWSNVTQRSVSGKKTRIGYWNYPLWRWEIKFDFLRGAKKSDRLAAQA